MQILYITSFIPKKNADQAGINVSFDIIKTIKENVECKIDLIGLVNENQYKIEDMKDVKEYVEEIEFLRNQTLKINEIMKRFFLKMDLKLVDFKLEFGKDSDGKIILADEISPDTCRLWDVNTNEKLDKDRFRRDLGDLVEGYEEVLARLNK